jgi:hypothetical protein
VPPGDSGGRPGYADAGRLLRRQRPAVPRRDKTADSAALIGVPWAFGSDVGGAAVPDNAEWNDTVLGQEGRYVGFVDAHYYPFSFSGRRQQQSERPADPAGPEGGTRTVPADLRRARPLRPADPGVAGETGVSNNETTTVCTPAGALFATGDVLSWLTARARSVDWWDMNNYGNTGTACTSPTTGRESPALLPRRNALLRLPAGLGAGSPHVLLSALATSDPADVLAFQSRLPGGRGVSRQAINSIENERYTPSPPLVMALAATSVSRSRTCSMTGNRTRVMTRSPWFLPVFSAGMGIVTLAAAWVAASPSPGSSGSGSWPGSACSSWWRAAVRPSVGTVAARMTGCAPSVAWPTCQRATGSGAGWRHPGQVEGAQMSAWICLSSLVVLATGSACRQSCSMTSR